MREELIEALVANNLKKFVTILREQNDINVAELIDSSIENFSNKIAKYLIAKYNKYDGAAQLALEYNNFKLLKYLCEESNTKSPRLNVNETVIRNLDGRFRADDFELFEFLLKHKYLENRQVFTEILCLFAKHNKEKYVKKYVAYRNIDLNQVVNCALENGNIEIVDFLVNHGADQVEDSKIQDAIQKRKQKELKDEASVWMKGWVQDSRSVDHDLSSDLINELEQSLTESQYTLYRGMTWSKKEAEANLSTLDFNKMRIGNSLNIKLDKLTSWSTNIKVGQFFATKRVLGDSKGTDYGLVLKVDCAKDDALVDLRDRDTSDEFGYSYFEDSLATHNHQEIVMKQGTYNCQIVYIRILDYILEL